MHWDLYRQGIEEELCQGDILDPSPLRNRLRGHQDYYAEADHFVGYAVITQSCDLAREGARPDFILLSVVRQLEDALAHRNVEDSAASARTLDLLRDLLNHQYNKRGFFYLPADENAGMPEDCVVDLRVMFSVHKSLYPYLLDARLTSISDVYAAQLGHMVGHMFGRVAVPGFEEDGKPGSVAKRMLEDLKVREQARLRTLMSQHGRDCTVAGCHEEAQTYRWAIVIDPNDVPEHGDWPLCLQHAHEWDNGRLR